MPDFSLRQLRYFVAAHDAGSIAVAAEREYVSASAVSAAVAHLESTLGVQLFVRRHAQGVSGTPQGRALVAEARALLKQAEEFQRLGRGLAGELAGELRVGCLVTLAATVVPGTLRSFGDTHPGIGVTLAESGHQDLIEGLRSGGLDVAITYDLSREPGLVFEAIRDLPPVVLVAAGHPLAGARSVALARLAGEPLVLLDLPISREYFLGLFRSRRLAPRIGARSRYLDVVCSMVGNGAGYSLLNVPPAAGRAADGSRLATIALAGSHRALRLGLLQVAAERRTRAAAEFAAHCRAALAA
jgi:DNA-binding transcriptional LysR family regulator